MKKLFAAILATLMTVSCVSFVSAKEITLETGKDVGVAIENVEATTEDTRIQVPISIAFAEGKAIAGAKIIVNYDTTKLNLIIEAPNEDEDDPGSPYWTFKKAAAVGAINTTVPGQITANFAAATGSSATANGFFMLEFAPVAGATGDALITFDVDAGMYFMDENSEELTFQTTDGKVSFPTPKYTVNFETEFGAAPDAVENVEHGTEIDLPEITDEVEGKTFIGWTDGENIYNVTDKYTVTGAITLNAVWETAKYDVTFDANLDGVENPEKQEIEYDKEVTLPTLSNVPAGYEFLGWTLGDDTFAAGDEYTVTGDVEFVASWETDSLQKYRDMGYTIVYISTTGAGTGDGSSAANAVKIDNLHGLLQGWGGYSIDRTKNYVFALVSDYEVVTDKHQSIEGKTVVITSAGGNIIMKGTPYFYSNGGHGEVIFDNIHIENSETNYKIYGTGSSITLTDTVTSVEWTNNSEDVDEDNHIKLSESGNTSGLHVFHGHTTVWGGFNRENVVLSVNNPYTHVLSSCDTVGQTATSNITYEVKSNAKVNTIYASGDASSENVAGEDNKANRTITGNVNVNVDGGTVTNLYPSKSGVLTGNLTVNVNNGGTINKLYTRPENADGKVGGYFVTYLNSGSIGEVQKNDVQADGKVILVVNENAAEVPETIADGALTHLISYKGDGTVTFDFDNNKMNVTPGENANFVRVTNGEDVKVYNLSGAEVDLQADLSSLDIAAGITSIEFIKAYNVTVNGVTTPVAAGSTITLTKLPAQGGFTHIGWAKTEGATEAEIPHTTDYAPTSDVILYPVWAEQVSFTLSFESAHGDAFTAIDRVDDDGNGQADETVIIPGYDTAVKYDTHFTFLGWAIKGEEDNVVYYKNDVITLEGDLTLVAKWEEDPKATVTYVDAKGTAPAAVTDYVGTEIDVAAPGTVEGFTFLGWTEGETTYQPGDKLTIDADGATLTASWDTLKYTVTFGSDYGTVPEAKQNIENGTQIDLPAITDEVEGKTFIGWTDGENIYNVTDKYTVTGAITLNAVWETAKYDVTFDANLDGVENPEKQEIEYGKIVTLPTLADVRGYTFLGWTFGGDTFNAGDEYTVTGRIEFVASWNENPKATITYVDTNATAPAAVTDYVGTEIEVAAPGTFEGLYFLGWTEGGTTYQPGDKLTIDADGATLTAKWGVKIAVNTNGATRGEAPVICGAVGEEIDLPTTVELKKVNHAFRGFALTPDGEIITGKYTVNPEDTLYVIWEKPDESSAVIETKVTYYTGTEKYLVDLYFYGDDASTVAFGYEYSDALEFVSFTPASGLSIPFPSLVVNEDGYYVSLVANETPEVGKIEGSTGSAGNGIHLGTIKFRYTGEEENAAPENNIIITSPKAAIEFIASTEYFLYTPAILDLEVEGLPIVFDEGIEYEAVDVEYPVTGSVKVVREDGTAPRNFAKINVFTAERVFVKSFNIEDAETTTVDGIFDYKIELPKGEYIFSFEKAGYLAEEVEVTIEAQASEGPEGFEPTPVELVTLTAGDIVAELGSIDLLDFVAITSAFGRGDLEDAEILALDINENGAVTVDDLMYIKNYLISN